ncbi:adhesion G-protein coupled receptor G1-like [Cyprinodon tularosa]|uniref:adhesion G-protein coupled receptor G1-like n=1 Tax=Cyprinodon tularosa TaxID=77115 RepID=UPI0018E219FE|nr:adhesion G-protein coupled receptor G1-like [Cyprinodon tularosa]
METLSNILQNVPEEDAVRTLEILQETLDETEVTETTTIITDNSVALLYKPTDDFKGLEIFATDNEISLGPGVNKSIMKVHLPSKLNLGRDDIISFFMIQLPSKIALENSDKLIRRRIISLSVRNKRTSGLPDQDRVKITINIATKINETLKPQCVFLNTRTNHFSTSGCKTYWDDDDVTCSCNHLTYFGVLMGSADLSPKDQEIMSYITIIGCSISLTALAIAVLLFITNREVRGDDSKKIHISLAVALILLNVHFLPNQAVAATSSPGLCLYVAVVLHYSLLASFTWMALEGFHLYLLLFKVFNIYVKRYLLKLSVVGWGLPALIVSVVVIVDKNLYGYTPLISSGPNELAV